MLSFHPGFLRCKLHASEVKEQQCVRQKKAVMCAVCGSIVPVMCHVVPVLPEKVEESKYKIVANLPKIMLFKSRCLKGRVVLFFRINSFLHILLRVLILMITCSQCAKRWSISLFVFVYWRTASKMLYCPHLTPETGLLIAYLLIKKAKTTS